MSNHPYTKKVQSHLSNFADLRDASMEKFCSGSRFSDFDLSMNLKEEGTGWNTLKDLERKSRCAIHALANPRAKMDELSRACSFTDHTYISSKFRQWFGFAWIDYKSRPTDHQRKVLREAAYS